MDQLLVPDDPAQQSVFPGVPDRQLHHDGREHRLRHRHLEPVPPAQGGDAL